MTAPKTVRVRIAVRVETDGDWSASGFRDADGDSSAADTMWNDSKTSRVYWVEADVPIPSETIDPPIEGEVVT